MRYVWLLLLLSGCYVPPKPTPPMIRMEYPKAPCQATKQIIQGDTVILECDKPKPKVQSRHYLT